MVLRQIFSTEACGRGRGERVGACPCHVLLFFVSFLSLPCLFYSSFTVLQRVFPFSFHPGYSHHVDHGHGWIPGESQSAALNQSISQSINNITCFIPPLHSHLFGLKCWQYNGPSHFCSPEQWSTSFRISACAGTPLRGPVPFSKSDIG